MPSLNDLLCGDSIPKYINRYDNQIGLHELNKAERFGHTIIHKLMCTNVQAQTFRFASATARNATHGIAKAFLSVSLSVCLSNA